MNAQLIVDFVLLGVLALTIAFFIKDEIAHKKLMEKLDEFELDEPHESFYDPIVDLRATQTVPAHWAERIERFNRERGLIDAGFNQDTEVMMLSEELEEFASAIIETEQVDALCDIIVVAVGSLLKLGYDVDCVMQETLEEIESRRGSIGKDGKWHKDRKQNPSTLYKANYTKCKEEK